MKSFARFLTLSRAIALGFILLTAGSAAHSQASNHDELSEIVPAVDDLLPDPDEPNILPVEVIAAFLASDSVTLYVVSEAEGTQGPIQDYKVVGKARINKNDTAALIEDLKHSLAEHNGVAMCGLCFHAHHVLRAQTRGHTYDLMICYPCSQVLTYARDSTSARHFISANWMNGSPDLIKRIAKSYGLPQPQVFIDEELNAQYEAKAYAHWLSTMPQSLRPFFPPTLDPSGNSPAPDLRAMRTALAKEYPDTRRRILALFSWYGSVPWGYSSDQSVDYLLQDYSYTDLWSQAQSDRLTNAQLAGAARFFAEKYVEGREQHSRRALQDGIRKYSEEKAHWLQIMPASIRPLWKDDIWQYGEYRHRNADKWVLEEEKPMLDALSREFPDKNQRILILFNWYGSDVENHTFGRYQAVVDDLLQQFTTAELAQALGSTMLTAQQLDGAVRLFAEPQFGRARRAEIRRIPSSLKAVLLAHNKGSNSNATLRWLLVQSIPTPGDGVVTPDRVEQVLPLPDEEYVDFVTVESTQAEPQFAVLMVPGTPMDDSFLRRSPTEDVGPPCINTGKARYLVNKFNRLSFEILANCGKLTRGYSYVICRLSGDLRCAEAPYWYFTGRTYLLTNEGLKVDGTAPHPWKDPIETQIRLQAMAARINQNKNRSSQPHASHDRWLYCRMLDPPNLTNVFSCSGRENLEMCKDLPSLDGIRDGDVIDMNSPIGRWVTQHSKDSDTSQSACWIETH
jgi:hypothetical protein